VIQGDNMSEKARPTSCTLIRDDEEFERMTLCERLQHGVLVFSFITLVLTGLPVFLYQLPLFSWAFTSEYAFWFRGIVHRSAAIGLISVSVFHAFWVVFTKRGRKTFIALMLQGKDITDAFESLMYNLGLTSWLYSQGKFVRFFQAHPNFLFLNPPRYGRYNFIEKFEYVAVIWGNVVMIATGFMLWYPVLAAALFPLWVLDILRIMHGFEAMLAMLSIAIWHMYNVHLNPEVFPMNTVWLTGKISGHELRTLHPLEFEQIGVERQAQLATEPEKEA
jgi:cytochrome b subunit of formate dehydrogenase